MILVRYLIIIRVWIYIEHLEDVIQENFEGLRIVLDLAHGSAVSSGKRLFEDLGLKSLL